MTLLEQYKHLVGDSAPSWIKSVTVMKILHEMGETPETYQGFLGADDEESFLSLFNITRFIKEVENRKNLKSGYYWVKQSEDRQWEVGLYEEEDACFGLVLSEYPLDIKEAYAVCTTPITKEDMYE